MYDGIEITNHFWTQKDNTRILLNVLVKRQKKKGAMKQW